MRIFAVGLLEASPPRIAAEIDHRREDLLRATRAGFALTPNSFHFSQTDPLAAVADVPAPARTVLLESNACLSCHSFRGAGARAGHLEATTGDTKGGFALPLESYPAEVWRRFVFDPDAASKLIGVRPNPVPTAVAQQLHDLVAAQRGTSPVR